MGRRTLSLIAVVTLAITACGVEDGGLKPPDDPDAPLLQIRAEGGFAPVEFVLSRGPSYTLLADGRLISQGPQILIYPAPLLPTYQVSQIAPEDMEHILELVEEIGLPDMTHEVDNTHASTVADATTEVVTYWSDEGIHQYSVYALGLEPESDIPSTTALGEMIDFLNQVGHGPDQAAYEPERVRVLAGVAMAPVEPGFEDVRPWPLGDDDPADWETLPLGWSCEIYGPEVLDIFENANQLSQWTHPDPMMDAPTFSLVVRPLHPGEEDCEVPSPRVTA